MFHMYHCAVDDVLSWSNSNPDYSYSCFDYYSNYRSIVGYGWDVLADKPVNYVELTYTSEEIGRRISLKVGDVTFDVTLEGGNATILAPSLESDDLLFGKMRGGVFDNPVNLQRVSQWQVPDSSSIVVPSSGFSNWLMKKEIFVQKPSLAIFDIVSGNGAELLIDGKAMMKHLNPYRTAMRSEKVLLALQKGKHEIVLRSFNRFEDTACAGLSLSDSQIVHKMKVRLPLTVKDELVRISVSALDRDSQHTDCGLHNLRLRLLRK